MLKIGGITKYLSQPLLRGFTTAAAFHVASSQIQHILGIYQKPKHQQRVFKIIYVRKEDSFLYIE